MPSFTNTLLVALSALSLVLAFNSHARATGDILCTATDGSGASISIGIGRLPVLAIISATATDGAETWSTSASGSERPFIVGQGFMDDRQVLVDFTDPNVERIVVSLRLFQLSGDKAFAEAGVLSFEGVSAFPVQCENG